MPTKIRTIQIKMYFKKISIKETLFSFPNENVKKSFRKKIVFNLKKFNALEFANFIDWDDSTIISAEWKRNELFIQIKTPLSKREIIRRLEQNSLEDYVYGGTDNGWVWTTHDKKYIYALTDYRHRDGIKVT